MISNEVYVYFKQYWNILPLNEDDCFKSENGHSARFERAGGRTKTQASSSGLIYRLLHVIVLHRHFKGSFIVKQFPVYLQNNNSNVH